MTKHCKFSILQESIFWWLELKNPLFNVPSHLPKFVREEIENIIKGFFEILANHNLEVNLSKTSLFLEKSLN